MTENKIFKENADKKFLITWTKKIEVQTPLPTEERVSFWSKIWKTEKTHNDQAGCIKGGQEAERLEDIDHKGW